MTRAMIAVLFVLLLASSAIGQVTAVVTGPKEATAGDLIVLDASRSSNALKFRWLLVNSKKTFLPVESDMKCVFASSSPGEYLFVLVAAGVDANKQPDVAIAEHRVVLKGRAPPVPPVPPPGPNPPDPTPPGKAARFIIVTDSVSDTAAENKKLLQLRHDKFFADKLYVLDKSQAPAKYEASVSDVFYPHYFVEDKRGKVIANGHANALHAKDWNK